MSPFVPPDKFVIHETEHWWVNHRCDTSYPGYLMIGAKDPNGESLSDLSEAAQAQLGPLLPHRVIVLLGGDVLAIDRPDNSSLEFLGSGRLAAPAGHPSQKQEQDEGGRDHPIEDFGLGTQKLEHFRLPSKGERPPGNRPHRGPEGSRHIESVS